MAEQTIPSDAIEVEVRIEPDEHQSDSEDEPQLGIPLSTGTSLASTVFNYRQSYQIPRRGYGYHGLKDGAYLLPNDKREQDRMDLQHFIYCRVLDGRLHCAPLKRDPGRVLDLGTGTGSWAVEFADQHPTTEVLGTDLSPIQCLSTPQNCTFEIDDFETEWPYPTRPQTGLYDYIHAREITGSIQDYPKLFAQAYRHLAPGGFLEMQSMQTNFFSDDGTRESAVTAVRWQEMLVEASRRFGKELGVEERWRVGMEEAGFVGVKEMVYKVPLSAWPKDPHMKELGRYQAAYTQKMLQSYSLALFTRVLGWSKAELDALLEEVGNDLRDPKAHLYAKVRVVYGQKGESE
ncbi:uncharacterized protein PADG_02083 [Paracoccidioides brasiliensis Pb18]|uniref:Methyltransferase domain-containing protein n=1 Tax=Paracoccidioides brasiliensis (strain Pb18) TaxID=502780 RepID=C1G1R7_PARBD|nr:uncharacterized protein PADG_02083 [Paracoccidioides brasiliensis Pb18]EEH45933.2 hypothetical protein PADG_02083 [Paracoccidioides brasiliensis Pb18]